MIHRIISIVLLACCLAGSCGAGQVQAGEDVDVAEGIEAAGGDAVDFDEELDEVEIDVESGIDYEEDRRGFSVYGDLRAGYAFAGDDFQDVTLGENDVLRARWRLRSTLGIADNFRGVIRLAGLCSSESCDPDFVLQPNTPTATSLDDGQITIDSLFLHWFRSDQFDVAVGRMETKFVARGGVFAKSLDRNNSNNLRVNWTDGLHSTFRGKNGWASHMILQYNDEDGAGGASHPSLDFASGESRVSYFFALENLEAKRRLIQRAFDITYMPSSLRVDGLASEVLEDYWGIVVRAANRWPVRSEGWRIRLSSEVGYAPNTPTNLASGIAGDGKADGLAWNVTASVMDFLPNHSIGVNFAMTEAGWLLSPQYRDNERLMEVRYVWRPTDRLTLDIRGRWRDDLEQRLVEDSGRDRFDFYARFTWSFAVLE